jgi:hypothetical protein
LRIEQLEKENRVLAEQLNRARLGHFERKARSRRSIAIVWACLCALAIAFLVGALAMPRPTVTRPTVTTTTWDLDVTEVGARH